MLIICDHCFPSTAVSTGSFADVASILFISIVTEGKTASVFCANVEIPESLPLVIMLLSDRFLPIFNSFDESTL